MTKRHQREQGVIVPTIKPRSRTMGNGIPIIWSILLPVFQMILLFAILALESVGVHYDAGRGTVYAGYWCSIIFFVTCITMFCYVCCRKSIGWGIYLIVQNIINIIFVIILIVFTSLFINNPCLCYGLLCKIPPWNYVSATNIYWKYEISYRFCPTRTIEKLPILKGLLSCAVLMLVLNLISILVYIINTIWLRNKSLPTSPIQPVVIPPYQPSPMIYVSNQYEQPRIAPTVSEPHYYSPAIDPIWRNESPSAYVMMRSEKF